VGVSWELSISLHSRQQHKLFSVLSPEDACVDVDVSRKTITQSTILINNQIYYEYPLLAARFVLHRRSKQLVPVLV
jgi:hypothetical protein